MRVTLSASELYFYSVVNSTIKTLFEDNGHKPLSREEIMESFDKIGYKFSNASLNRILCALEANNDLKKDMISFEPEI